MDLGAYDYDLPDDLIARFPASERRGSRLLFLPEKADQPEHCQFFELARFFRAGDVLVINNTRVIPARLYGRKQSGGKIEMLVERVLEDRQALVHIKASKTPKPGSELVLDGGQTVDVLAREAEYFTIGFRTDVFAYLDAHGHVPLPPYLGRDDDKSDQERYQTVYARCPGAVAAPTAGLHFDDLMLQELRGEGVNIAAITLHVGAGTFQNLRPEQLASGRLHSERLSIDAEACHTVNAARAAGARVFAVGTTSARALESAAHNGKLYENSGMTDLFIRPGFRFQIVDGLITNFHLPRSSLLMLLAAFAGRERVLAAYAAAIVERYRFYSYGDAMLCFRHSAGANV